MTKTKCGKILMIASSVLCVILGILFIVCCTHLYFTGGEAPYSRERVGEYLSYLIIPSAVTIVTLAVGYFLCESSKAQAVRRDGFDTLKLIKTRYSDESLDAEAKSALDALRLKRRIAIIACVTLSAIFVAAAAAFLILGCTFTVEDLNGDVTSALAVILPSLSAAIAVFIPLYYALEPLAKRECEILRTGKMLSSEEREDKKKNTRTVPWVSVARVTVAVVAIAFITVGILNGGMEDVLAKAVKICTECIGLG